MSRTEHDTFKESACLCGKGQVTKHVVSTDYVFGSAEVSYELECPACAIEWRFEHRTFTLRASERDYTAAKAALDDAQRNFATIAREVIDAHFATLELGTKKAELLELERLGLGGGNYRSYTAERRRNRTPGQIASIFGNPEGIVMISDDKTRPVIERLISRVSELEIQCKAATKKIVRRRIC